VTDTTPTEPDRPARQPGGRRQLALTTALLAAATIVAAPGLLADAYLAVRVITIAGLLAAFAMLAAACTGRSADELAPAGFVSLAAALAVALLVPSAAPLSAQYPTGTVQITVSRDSGMCDDHTVCYVDEICGEITGVFDDLLSVEAMVVKERVNGRSTYRDETKRVLLPVSAVRSAVEVTTCTGETFGAQGMP
jgi:hypothetical protein